MEANFIVYLVHILILVEEVFMLPTLEYAQVARLCSFDVISHEPSLDSLLQDHLRVALQGRVLIYMAPLILSFWVIVGRLLPKGEPVNQGVMGVVAVVWVSVG